MSKHNEMKPGKNGYKIVFATNTIVMNYKFAAAAAQYGTPEYKLMKKIRRDFPGMSEVVVSGRDKKVASPNTRFTYDNMKAHIRAYENADELLEVFKTVEALSKTCASPYKYVSDWFKVQFPDYNKPIIFKAGTLTLAPVDPPKVIEYKQKMPKVG